MARARPRTCVFLLALLLAAGPSGCSGPPAPADSATAERAEAGPAAPAPPAPPVSPPADPPPGPKIASTDPPPVKQGPAFLDAAARHDGKTLAEWTAQLGDADGLARSAAADAVARYGPNAKAAVPSLVALLRNPDDLSFDAAVLAIGEIGPAAGDAVDPLVVLLRHKKADVREAAAGTVWRLGPPAGTAVPALIDALDAARPGGEKARDAFRFPIQQLGKYDIRAVYAAVRRGKLTELDLDFVIGSLGPDDGHAVAGLVAELRDRGADPVTGNCVIYTLGGLKRIGTKAAPALPVVRPLLNDASPQVRKAAAEVIAAIGAGDRGAGSNKTGPEGGGPAVDLREAIGKAGFTGSLLHIDLGWYLRVGSKEAFGKHLRADRNGKAELEEAAGGNRAAVRTRVYRLGKLPCTAVRQQPGDGRELVLRVWLPLRVRGEKPFYEDAAAFTGILSRMHPSEVNGLQHRFLAKDGSLRACTPAEAAAVRRSGGVTYHPEESWTTLFLVVKGSPEALRVLADDAKDYSVEIEFTDLRLERPLAWGCFRTDAYADAGRDCQKLWTDYLLDRDNPQPVYFPTAFLDTNSGAIPEVVRARLEALRVRDKNGLVLGGYRVR